MQEISVTDHTTHTVQFAAPMRFEDAHAFGDAIPFLEGVRLVLLYNDGNGKTDFVTINTSRIHY